MLQPYKYCCSLQTTQFGAPRFTRETVSHKRPHTLSQCACACACVCVCLCVSCTLSGKIRAAKAIVPSKFKQTVRNLVICMVRLASENYWLTSHANEVAIQQFLARSKCGQEIFATFSNYFLLLLCY